MLSFDNAAHTRFVGQACRALAIKTSGSTPAQGTVLEGATEVTQEVAEVVPSPVLQQYVQHLYPLGKQDDEVSKAARIRHFLDPTP